MPVWTVFAVGSVAGAEHLPAGSRLLRPTRWEKPPTPRIPA